MAGDYFGFAPVRYPSFSDAYKQFEGGLMGLAQMQSQSAALEDKAEERRLSYKERMRTAELDSQRFVLETAKEQRAADNEATKNFIELSRLQIERETNDLKLMQLRDEMKIKKDQAAADAAAAPLMSKLMGSNHGERLLVLGDLVDSGQVALMSEEKQKVIYDIQAKLDEVKIGYSGSIDSPMNYRGGLKSDDPEVRMRSAAVAMKLGASEDSIRRHGNFQIGEMAAVRELMKQVEVNGDGTLTASIKAAKSGDRMLSMHEDLVKRLVKEKGSEDDPEVSAARANMEAYRLKLEAAKFDLSEQGIMVDGKVVSPTSEAARLSALRGRDDTFAVLVNPNTREHQMAFAALYKASADIDGNKKLTDDQKAQAKMALRRQTLHPDEIPTLSQAYAEAFNLYRQSSPTSPEAERAVVAMAQIDARVSPILRAAGLAVGASPTTVIGGDGVAAVKAGVDQREARDANPASDPAIDPLKIAGSASGISAIVSKDEFTKGLNSYLSSTADTTVTPMTDTQARVAESEMKRMGLLLVADKGDGTLEIVDTVKGALMYRPTEGAVRVMGAADFAARVDPATQAKVAAAVMREALTGVGSGRLFSNRSMDSESGDVVFDALSSPWVGPKGAYESGLNRGLSLMYATGDVKHSAEAVAKEFSRAGKYPAATSAAPGVFSSSSIESITGQPTGAIPTATTRAQEIAFPLMGQYLMKAVSGDLIAADRAENLLNAALVYKALVDKFPNSEGKADAYEYFKLLGVSSAARIRVDSEKNKPVMSQAARSLGVSETKATEALELFYSRHGAYGRGGLDVGGDQSIDALRGFLDTGRQDETAAGAPAVVLPKTP